MASQQDIKRRIRSVRNTRKITKALELVSASKLRRAQARIEALRPYADRMHELEMEAASRANVQGSPLLTRREVKVSALCVLTGDRGLAGAFNAQVLRAAITDSRSERAEGREMRWLAVGKRGIGSLRFRGLELLNSWQGFTDRPSYGDASAIAQELCALYRDGTVDRVALVYNTFQSALSQHVVVEELLPIPEGRLEELSARERALEGQTLFEPDAEDMLDELLADVDRDPDLPRAARVDGVRARCPDDGDGQRVEERERSDRRSHPRDEPRAPGGDHAGDPRGRGRSGRARVALRRTLQCAAGARVGSWRLPRGAIPSRPA